ncbi:MAG: hypothetical protein IPM24_14470 [Bryobacterales bacterium]|nr:hypothetical protein [Bryobacterales bacterium]
MVRASLSLILLFAVSPALQARQEPTVCGYRPEGWREEIHLHQRTVLQREQARRRTPARLAEPRRAPRADIGNIAILEDTDGVVARRNQFNLTGRALEFAPVGTGAARYRFRLTEGGYDAAAASAGVPVSGLGDDDFRELALPFAFPYFGTPQQSIFVNSDGNLTFGEGDDTISERSVGRMTAGPPRIAPLFNDLDPSRPLGSVRVLSEAGRWVVSWVDIPEYSGFGAGPRQTFQARLYPDGRIEFAYSVIAVGGAVVGIAPGNLQGSTNVVAFVDGSTQEYSSAIVERFGGVDEVDLVSAAQKFYENHDDAYDYLVFYNTFGLSPAPGAVALQISTRNRSEGIGDPLIDVGRLYGSSHRLQAVLDLGPLAQYPVDPRGILTARQSSRDTPLSILGHEAGHLFLAFASARDPIDPSQRPMLGFQSAHWAFTFNSEASLLEGNRIRDNGPGATPRFETIAVTEGFSPLDQYLMGLRPPEEVPPTFYVRGAGASFTFRQPQLGVSFNGERRDVTTADVIAAEGRRTPDHTVSQRRYRFAFVLIVRAGETPSPDVIEQLDRYRREFEPYFTQVTGGRGAADATLRRSVRLSAHPATGLVAGTERSVTVAVETPPETPLTVLLRSAGGRLAMPPSVTLAAGAREATFPVTGLSAGVDDLIAESADTRYDATEARIRVAAAPQDLELQIVSGDRQLPVPGQPLPQPVVIRVRDANRLGYPGVRVSAIPGAGGAADPQLAVTDADGVAQFRWTPESPTARLTVGIEGGAVATVAVLAGTRVSAAGNAASGASQLAPGGLATLFGENLTGGDPAVGPFPWPGTLAGVTVLIDGLRAPLLYVSDTQINFLVPDGVRAGNVRIEVANGGAARVVLDGVPVLTVAPGLFFNAASGFGAILNSGTAETTEQRPARRGGVIEVYCTGLGPVFSANAQGLRDTLFSPQVTIGGVPARVLFSGLAPGYFGLYQVNVEIPESAPAGEQPLRMAVNQIDTNTVTVAVAP